MLQMPPDVASVSAVVYVPPLHTFMVPVILAGKGLTVRIFVIDDEPHPLVTLNVTDTVLESTPVRVPVRIVEYPVVVLKEATPVAGSILHVPLVEARLPPIQLHPVKVAELFAHILNAL